MKVVQLHQWTPKQFLKPTLSPKMAHWGPKSKNNPKSKSKLNISVIFYFLGAKRAGFGVGSWFK